MSKLAHSNDETMEEIELQHAIESGNEDLIPVPCPPPSPSRESEMNYFVVAVSYPRTEDHPAEVQALVNPEETRRDIISNIARGEYRGEIAFIHAISGSCVEDVTRELIDAAALPEQNIVEIDLQALRNDYRRDVRKNFEPAE